MPYDALGNYNPGLESQQPSIDDMRLALMRQRQQPAVTAPPAAKLFGDIARGGLSNLESVARGAISAVPGAPGDLESAIRALANWSFGRGGVNVSEQTVLPTSAELRAKVPRLLQARPESAGMEEIGALGNLPGQQLGLTAAAKAIQAAPRAPAALLDALVSGPSAGSLEAQRGAIKMKGGNWIEPSVPKTLNTLKPTGPAHRDEALMLGGEWPAFAETAEGKALMLRNDALSNWIDNKLGSYIRKEMATPEDPVRIQADTFAKQKAELLAKQDARLQKARDDMAKAQAERGVTPEMLTRSRERIRKLEQERDYINEQQGVHLSPAQVAGNSLEPPMLDIQREMAGFPEFGYGSHTPARAWEIISDQVANPTTAAVMRRYSDPSTLQKNPWLVKLPDDAPVHEIVARDAAELGFNHLVDELKNALNPESGLPKHLQLGIDDISKLTVPRAVKLVDEINAWRAVQKKEANLALASNRATSLIKEYPETGMRWVELKTPEFTSPDQLSGNARAKYDQYLNVGVGPEVALRNAAKHDTSLRDALKYEGEMLSHCVGGYCPKVESGSARIISLRDDAGKPHATIELSKSGNTGDIMEDIDEIMQVLTPAESRKFNKFLGSDDFYGEYDEALDWLAENMPAAHAKYVATLSPGFELNQVKGYRNNPPAKYVGQIADYLNSLENIKLSSVGREDLKALGLVDIQDSQSLMDGLEFWFSEKNRVPQSAIDKFNAAVHFEPNAPRFMTRTQLRQFVDPNTPIKQEPQGFADGGQARKLPDPSLANATLWAETVSRQMYPSPDENVKRDAARHMMAAAIIANRTSPGVAEALGKAHELYGAPFKTMGHWLGLSQPRPDYPTDVHNNALGASMANLAANPEMLKQAIRDAIAKGTTQGIEPGKPALIPDQAQGMGYAAGGPVTPDDMRLALMMRKAN